MQGTSGLAHVSLVQADATVATTHSSGQPKPQGSIALILPRGTFKD